MPTATRSAVVSWLRNLADGKITREDAAEWADEFIREDALPDEPDVLEALEAMAAADLPSTDRPYLFGEADFNAWLTKLLKGQS